MPERTCRVVIQNLSKTLTLNHQFSHLCWGDWTPGGWTPPPFIGPGTSGGMQSESGGVLTELPGFFAKRIMCFKKGCVRQPLLKHASKDGRQSRAKNPADNYVNR
jgi:hypothetical protein